MADKMEEFDKSRLDDLDERARKWADAYVKEPRNTKRSEAYELVASMGNTIASLREAIKAREEGDRLLDQAGRMIERVENATRCRSAGCMNSAVNSQMRGAYCSACDTIYHTGLPHRSGPVGPNLIADYYWYKDECKRLRAVEYEVRQNYKDFGGALHEAVERLDKFRERMKKEQGLRAEEE